MKPTLAILTALAALIALPTFASARPHRGKGVHHGHRGKARAHRGHRARGHRYHRARRHRARHYRRAHRRAYRHNHNRYRNRTHYRHGRRYRRNYRRVYVRPQVPRRVRSARFCYRNPGHPACYQAGYRWY